MRYELNIGLDVAGGDNSYDARIDRYNSAVRAVRSYTNDFNGAFVGDLSAAEEPALYISIEVDVMDLIELGWKICDALSRDCIAVYIPSQSAGLLVGPRAAAWGRFNPEYFRRPAVAVAA